MERNIEHQLKTNLKTGLSEGEAKVRLANNGLNELKEAKKTSPILRFLGEFNDVLIYILLLSGIISILLKEYADAAIILFVVLMNGTIGFIQEEKANKAIEALKRITHQQIAVKRDNRIFKIDTTNLVVGDIVLLEEGNIVPADGKIFNTYNLLCDESALTGESHPVNKDEAFSSSNNTPISERLDEVFMSTLVLQGHSEMVVTKVGMNTEVGLIAKMLDKHKVSQTPLQKKLEDLGKLLGFITIAICVLLFLIALIQKRDVIEMFITSISLAVAAVPEGLPAVVTIVLAMGVQRLVKTNMIIRKLHAVETLGAVNVILTDKTGTLTENQMTVVTLVYDNSKYDLKNIKQSKTLDYLYQNMLSCHSLKSGNSYIGDPLEVAIVAFASTANKKFQYKKIEENSFSSEKKMMSVIIENDNKKIQFSKGASEEILRKCKYILINGKELVLDKIILLKQKELLNKLTSNALRVIAFAYKNCNQIDEDNMTFLGFVGMIDPPKKGTKEAVKQLKNAGIKTVMVTGDSLDTAFAIGKKLGVAESKEDCIEGMQFEQLKDYQKKEVIQKKTIFARVSPKNKIDIVTSFQKEDNLVAMTGDGVNDAPSLRKADVGIAMGRKGTDVAKSASDMILLDDNYSSIAKAVKEGRGIYANIKKTTLFLLSSNFAEVLSMLIGILLNLPMPLVPVHILWVNLITDSLPAIALGVDKNSDNIMNELPRKKNESLFAKGGYKILFGYGFLITILTIISFLIIPISKSICNYGWNNIWGNVYNLLTNNKEILLKSRSFAFVTLAMSQLFHMIGMSDTKISLFSIIKKKNYVLFAALLLGITLQILVINIPFLNNIFHTTSLNFLEWLFLITLSSTPLVMHELLLRKN